MLELFVSWENTKSDQIENAPRSCAFGNACDMVSVGEDGETKINQSSTFKVKMQHCFVPGTCTYFSSSSLKDKDFKKVSFCSGN